MPRTSGLFVHVRLIALTGLLGLTGSVSVMAGENRPDYLRIVQAYADTMLEQGRDRWGPVHTPLFASMLDRRTHELFDNPRQNLVRLDAYGIRHYDRAWNGSNPMHDQGLFHTLYGLSELTGDPKYAQAADEALTWFFENTRSPVTNLLAWGDHIAWDLLANAPTRHPNRPSNDLRHEYSWPGWTLWERVYQLTPQAALLHARGLWDHQIYDKQTGDFSRHARYDVHGPERHASFPRKGGHLLVAWAWAWSHSDDPDYRAEKLRAIETIVDSFDRRRMPQTDVLPAGTGPDFGNTYWLTNDLMYAIEASRAADMLPADLAQKLRSSAARSDRVITQRLPHPLTVDRGYIHRAHADTLQPGDPRGRRNDDIYSTLWDDGYGTSSTAWIAWLMIERYKQTQDPTYRHLAASGLDLYIGQSPDPSQVLHPSLLADLIMAMLDWHQLTGEPLYYHEADRFGQMAVELFFDEVSPLPKVTSLHDHYETISGGADLIHALYRLHVIPEPATALSSSTATLLLHRPRRIR